ncbi:hypothetical protein [Bacillus sp. SM2101]|uniref:hypothetical protein n=1 Tax=Bacillus sp. SM2101 TaxID=2805366 RepID=UPI001BDE71D1|nr:hypothetical protein [Bacillus sp. SM2101]
MFQVGDEVIHKPTSEHATVTEIDNLHRQVNIQFKDNGRKVVEMNTVRFIEKRNDIQQCPSANIHSHKIILDNLHDTYKRKNSDYRNSFSDQY